MKKEKELEMDSTLLAVEDEVRNLLDMFEFFLTERRLGKPIDDLSDTVKDMRLIIGRLLIDHFMNLVDEDEANFCSALASMLADRSLTIPIENEGDNDYYDYCIGEILTAFEFAQEIKEAYPNDHVLQKILALDVPILRPFDYGLRNKLKVVPRDKKRKMHG
jgi:hypothetical protein